MKSIDSVMPYCNGSRKVHSTWSRYRFPDSLYRFSILLTALTFLGYSIHFLGVDLERILGAFGRVGQLLMSRYYPPDLEYVLKTDYLTSILYTLEMSVIGGFFGVVIAIPLAWFSSFNVTPGRRVLSPLGNFSIISCRAIHETIWTILFVSVLGYGMAAGIAALTMFCIGFAGKLFSNEIEAVDMKPVEAMRAAGAGPLQVFTWAVLPQIRVAIVGIAIYTWDVAFRAATVVGFFGGGGMGWYLKRNIQQLETTKVGAIIITIVAIVVFAEFVSGVLRHLANRYR